MPIFYHYTCGPNIKGIFETGFLRKGTVAINAFDIDKYKAVNLTTDPSPIGHGLPDGREISNDEATFLDWHREKDGKNFCANHTKYRVEIILPDSAILVSARQFHSAQPAVLYALEIAGYFPTKKDLTDDELFQGRSGLADGTFLGKADTWWYYFDEIPVQAFLSVSVRDHFGQFLPMTPRHFECLLKTL